MDRRATTWWVLEDQGEIMRTAALDFCSLRCIGAFVADPLVRDIYALDFDQVKGAA